MIALRYQTGTRIAPFDDPVSSLPIGDSDLGQAVTRALTQAGCTPRIGETGRSPTDCPLTDCLVLPDRLFVTRALVRAFMDACPRAAGVYRLGLKEGPLTAWAFALQKVDQQPGAILFDLFCVRGPGPISSEWPALREALVERAQPVVIDPAEELHTIYPPRPGPPVKPLMLPRSELLAVDLSHWIHLVWLNQLLPWIRLREHRQDHPLLSRFGLSKVGLPKIGKSWFGLGDSLIGPGCDIHPAAQVEGSILGAGVRLGPKACVRDSILGERVELAENVRVKRCNLGAGCHALSDSYFIGCTFYPGSSLANFMLRDSVIGRQCFLTSGLIFWPEGITKTVRVLHEGTERDSRRWVLGSAAGHGCTLGTLGPRAVLAPGRALPNGTMLVMRPEEGLLKLPKTAQPGQAHVNQDGQAQPLAAVMPDWRAPELSQ